MAALIMDYHMSPWRLGDHIISGDLYTQTDSPEPLEPHKVTSSSELKYTFSREQEGQQVRPEIILSVTNICV